MITASEKSISLSPRALAIIQKLQDESGPSFSAAIERIIREWAATKGGK